MKLYFEGNASLYSHFQSKVSISLSCQGLFICKNIPLLMVSLGQRCEVLMWGGEGGGTVIKLSIIGKTAANHLSVAGNCCVVVWQYRNVL